MTGQPADGIIRRDVPLGRLTTYKLGGSAQYFSEPANRSELIEVARWWAAHTSLPLLFIGRGSNLVVSDRGFPGLVVRLSGSFGAIRLDMPVVVAGAAVPLPILARKAVAAGGLGLEWCVGIPGSVGGAVHQNAGCHGSETAEWLVDADVLSFREPDRIDTRTPVDLDLGYRHSNLDRTDVVVSARFRTVPGAAGEGERAMREVTRWRKRHQPGGTLNAGSVFKNPPGDAAGRLIDAAGLKGLRIGGASVSERHANFFVAGADATAADLWSLMNRVRTAVRERFDVDLEPEIAFVGPFER